MRLVIENLTQFRKNMNQKGKAILKAGIKTQREAAELTMYHAKRLAPYKTGETISGITVKSLGKKGYQCVSTVPGSFKQNMWANQTGKYKRPRMWWNQGVGVRFAGRRGLVTAVGGKPTLYGDGSHKITGTPRFFDRAVQNVQKQYRSIAVRNVQDALQTGKR